MTSSPTFTRRITLLVLSLVATWLVTVTPASAATDPVRVIGGADPSTVTIEVSRARFGEDQATRAVLARDDEVADSLAASSLLGDGPLLVTPPDRVSDAILTELQRVLPAGGEVILVGGEAALGPAVQSAVADAGLEPRRVGGRDRVATAAAVAAVVIGETTSASDPTAMLAVGWPRADDPTGSSGWADAISGGAVAADRSIPILLTAPDRLSAATSEAIDDLGIGEITVLGGTGAVSGNVSDRLGRLGHSVLRAAGVDRQDTGWRLAQMIWGSGVPAVTVAPGWSDEGWIAGLSAAGIAADRHQPLVLARPDGSVGACADLIFVGAWADVPAYGIEAHRAYACGTGPVPLRPGGSAEIAARGHDGRPLSWCGTMSVAVNYAGAPAAAPDALRAALLEVERATGLTVTLRTTTERASYPATRADGWFDEDGDARPVLVSWPADWPDTNTIGYGSWLGRGDRLLTGAVTADSSVSDPRTLTSLLLHELGHVLGFGHVDDSGEVMGPAQYPPKVAWGPGERYALAEQAAWCP